MTPNDARVAAVAFLKRLLEHGRWYVGAIELHGGPLLGDDLKAEAEGLIRAAETKADSLDVATLTDGYYWYVASPDDPTFAQGDFKPQIVEVCEDGAYVSIGGVEETIDIDQIHGRFVQKVESPL